MQKSILNTTLVRGVSAISNFLLVLIVAKFLGPKAKGEASSVLTTVSFVVFFCSVIGGQSYVYILSKRAISSLLFPAYCWSLFISIVSFFIFFSQNAYSAEQAVFIAIISFLTTVLGMHSAILLSKQRMIYYNLFQALPVVLTLIVTNILFFSLELKDIRWYFIAVSIGLGMSAIWSAWLVKKDLIFANFSTIFQEIKSIFSIGLEYQVLEFFQLLNMRFYFYMLLYLQGNTDLGYFSVGVSLYEFSWIFARSAQSIFYSKLAISKEDPAFFVFMNQFVKLSVLLSLIASLVLLVMPDSFYSNLFGDYYVGINRSVRFFIPGVVFYNVYLIYQSYYLSTGRYGGLIWINAISFVSCLLFGYFFIPTRFFSGASGAASVGFMLSALLLTIRYLRDTKQTVSIFVPNRGDWVFIHSYVKSIFKRV